MFAVNGMLTRLDCQLGQGHKPRTMKMIFKSAVYLKQQNSRVATVLLLDQTYDASSASVKK